VSLPDRTDQMAAQKPETVQESDEITIEDLPEGWLLTSVGDLFQIVGGGTPSTKIPEYWEGNIPWISSADIYGIKKIVPRRTINQNAIKNSAANLVPKGSIIVVTRVSLGRIAICDTPISFSQDCHALIPKTDSVDPQFALYYLSQAVQSFKNKSRGTTISGVTVKVVSSLPFLLPPLAEQQHIVTRVEALLPHVDAAGDRLSRVPAIMKRFRQSVLAAACSGRLTEEWREENPDIEPMNISKNPTRTKKANEKFLENLQILKELDFPPLPDGWISSNGDTIFRSVTSGSRGWAQYYSDNGASFIRIGNLTRDSISLDLNNVQKVNPPDNAERNRISVQKDDILISITADIGSIGFVSNEIGEAYVNQHIALCRPIDQVYPEYIALFLLSEEGGKKQFVELQHGATKIGLGLDDIRAVYIPLPPLAEQREIVRRVGLLFECADAIDREVAAAGRRCERLTQAVMVKAFSGRL